MGHSQTFNGRRRATLLAAIAGVLLALALTAGLLLDGSASGSAPDGKAAQPSKAKAPHIKHFFVIILENENADETFGAASEAPYLAKTLVNKGAFLPNYYATGHFSLDNYLSMISGQAPNPVAQADCAVFSEFTPATPAADGQYVGTGCVYPPQVKTVADQLTKKKLTWKGFMEDMAGQGSDPASSCRHPAIGAVDTTQRAEVGDQYATRHNPFVYFHSIIDTPSCKANDVDLSKLPASLKSAAKTPAYTFITPNLCHDGHDEPCVNGEPGGLTSANLFLKQWVPRILKSPGYKDHGMLMVSFDEAEAAGAEGDSSACCNEQSGPNTTNPGFVTSGPGGGRIGAVVVSPCTRAGTVAKRPYNHYSQLRWVEDNFGLKHLGYAGQPGLAPFGRDVLNKPDCGVRKPDKG